jgi:branched-chain amino acid transport system permease protein
MFVELLLNGLVQGSLLALICIGYSLAYGTARVLNFAHADAMIAGGGYLVLLLSGTTGIHSGPAWGMATLFGTAVSTVVFFWGAKKSKNTRFVSSALSGATVAGFVFGFAGKLPFLFSALLAIPLTAFLTTAIYRVVYLPLMRKAAARTSLLIVSFGASIALESLLLVFWGSQRKVFSPEILPQFLVVRPLPEGCGFWKGVAECGILQLSSHLRLPVRDALIVIVFIGTAAALVWLFKFSRHADAIVATADDRIAAQACGIPVDRVLGHAFFAGGAIAAIGGTFYVLRSASLDPMAGFTPGILAFVACVLGGIGSLKGSVAGAFLVAMIASLTPAIPLDQWAAANLHHEWLHWLPSLKLNDWSYGLVYVLMIVTILFKPRGLFVR